MFSPMFSLILFCFFFNDTATTEIYTLSLHDALPIRHRRRRGEWGATVRHQGLSPSRRVSARSRRLAGLAEGATPSVEAGETMPAGRGEVRRAGARLHGRDHARGR